MAPGPRGWEEMRVGIAFVTVAAIAVTSRFAARWVKKLRLELDDWLTIASMTLLIVMLVELILWATIGNSGKHFSTLTPHQIELFFKIFLSNEFTYGATSPMVKLTLLAFYRRVFSIRRFRIAVDIVAAACIAWGISTIVVSGLQCVPLEKYWNPMVPGHCINVVAFVQGIQGINIFLDLTILLLPMPMVWKLQRPWQDKLALSAVFALGLFAVVASAVRMYTLTLINVHDISWTTYEAMIWTFVEPCIGLTCACLPIVRSLFPAWSKSSSQISKSNNTARTMSVDHANRSSRFLSPDTHYFASAEYAGYMKRDSDVQSSGDETVVEDSAEDKVIRIKKTVEVV